MVETENYWLNKYRDDFTKQLDGLKNIKTNEELADYTKQLNIARDKLMEHDEDFRKFVESNQAQMKLVNAARRHEANTKSKIAIAEANKKSRQLYHPTLPPSMVTRRR